MGVGNVLGGMSLDLARVEDLASRGVSAEAVRAAGDPSDELSVPEAVRLVGVSPSYLARLCRTYLNHEEEITAAFAEGSAPKRSFLSADGTQTAVTRSLGPSWRPSRSGDGAPPSGSATT